MNFAVFYYFFFLNILLTCSDTDAQLPTSSICIGPFLCGYFGSLEGCALPITPITSLPETCSGFYFDGFIMDDQFVVQNCYGEKDKEFTIELSKTKPTFATLGYYSWDRAFDPNTDLKPQLEGIKTFYNEVKLSGLILKDVFKECNANLDDISQKIQTYVQYMKTGLPGLKFGLKLEATHLKKYTDCTVGTDKQCLDFLTLSQTLDVIIVTFESFNRCEQNYVLGGTVPVNGQTGNTLTNYVDVIKKAIVPPLQVLLMFDLSQYVLGDTPDKCYSTVNSMCSGQKCPDHCCMDNSSTLYEKGNFVKNLGVSVVANLIDLNDSDGCQCECGFPYPSLQYLKNGYYNGDKTLKCSKLDVPPK